MLADQLEAGKSQLKGHLSERTAELAKVKRELKQARDLQRDDVLIGLYNSGANLLTKQADEIKTLKSELQRGKDEHEKSKSKLVEKNNQISKVEDEKKNCREAVRRLQDRLAALELGSPKVQGKSDQESAKSKQHIDSYLAMVDEQQKKIDKLTQENARLVMALGRQHFNEMDLP